MKKLFLALLLSCSAWSTVITQTLVNTGGVNPGFSIFTIDGVTGQRLLCDEFLPNITSSSYQSLVYGLADLTSSSDVSFIRPGSGNTLAQAIEKYKIVALLDRMAYANPANAADVVRANRRVGGSSMVTTANSDLLLAQATALALTTSIAQLSDFRIYNSPLLNASQPALGRLTQEMTGIIGGGGGNIPEPGTMLLLGAGLAGIAMFRRRQNL